MSLILSRPDTIIVIAPELAGFYEFVKPRQEAEYETIVVLLDRRQQADRRQMPREVPEDRRQLDRRAPSAEAARALTSVLGFAVLHRVGERYVP